MKYLIALALAVSAGAASARQVPEQSNQPYKIVIRHADPWAVKAMMEGQGIVSPEMSTILGFMGLPQNAAQGVASLVKNGKLVVNPTDNSLWFFPDK